MSTTFGNNLERPCVDCGGHPLRAVHDRNGAAFTHYYVPPAEHEQPASSEGAEWVYNYTNEHSARHGGWHIRIRNDNGDCLAHALNEKTAAIIIRDHRLAALVPGLTDVLRNLSAAIVAVQDNPEARFGSETKKAIRNADAALDTIAKESQR